MTHARKPVWTVVAALAVSPFIAHAQIVPADGHARAQNRQEAVTYLFPEQVTLAAGKPSTISLHFRVAQGLHINSHAPSDDSLIPTVFSVPAASGVHLEAASYPAGAEMTLSVDPNTKLNVYTGDFVIEVRFKATSGDHLVQGKLHYQACDQEKCMPPKTIAVPIDVIGK